jgi:hypothetical protein
MSSWNFSDSSPPPLPSPSSAYTRERSTSAARGGEAVSPGYTEVSSHAPVPRGSMTSMFTQTLTSTPGSALRSAGGSILGGYSPDPFHPMPRAFESLTSFPTSPETVERIGGTSNTNLVGRSPAVLGRGVRSSASASTLAFVPELRQEAGRQTSAYTLQSYYSASSRPATAHDAYEVDERPGTSATANSMAYITPKSQVRASRQSYRAPPPPPMPLGMPLPPTPTAARSETLWDRSERESVHSVASRDSVGMWDEVDEWVNVRGDGEELESWGRGGRGVGVLGMAGAALCSVSS